MINEFEKIFALNEKMNHLLETVKKNGGNFSPLDKDLITGYLREVYELALSIQPVTKNLVTENPAIQSSSLNGDFEKTPDHKTEKGEEINHEEIVVLPKDNGVKKTLSELYAEREEKNSVNERFKRQSAEVADKLKQTPIRDLKSYIGLNKRFAFIGTLFNDEEHLYEQAVTQVNSFNSYEEAVNYIKTELLTKFHWEEEEEPLVNEFFTLVMRRYLH